MEMLTNLTRLQLLQGIKAKMPNKLAQRNISPFASSVTTLDQLSFSADVPAIHDQIRYHIESNIIAVRDGKKQSQIILLSGAPGTGKTHLLLTFREQKAMNQLRHIFVGGPNHWKIEEFQARLLDWMIEALISPSPNEPHLLLERIQTIGFRAVELLLANPKNWKRYLKRESGWLRGRILNWWYRPSYEKIEQMVKNRDPELFRFLNFAEFSNYVCDRFLVERANLNHRFALRVLLLYLFPDDSESGVGTRERILHWFRNEGDQDYFIKRLGASEKLDQNYRRFDAVKLLTHLFSPYVSQHLATPEYPCESRVFLLAFDQVEGRDELFENEDDWNTFFAQLSELYNSLPNVVILFTMTLGLKNTLHNKMERQFRDRIIMDEHTVLQLPTESQLKEVYVQRMRAWLADQPSLVAQYDQLNQPYIPFEEAKIQEFVARDTLRNALKKLDQAFHQSMDMPIEPLLDYAYKYNNIISKSTGQSEYDFTANHLTTLVGLLNVAKDVICAPYSLVVSDMNQVTISDTPVLRIKFKRSQAADFVVIHLARLGYQFVQKIPEVVDGSLYNAEKARHHLMILRPKPMTNFKDYVKDAYKIQTQEDVCPAEVEAKFSALFEIANQRDAYGDPKQQSALDELIVQEIRETYLERLLKHVANHLSSKANPSGQTTI